LGKPGFTGGDTIFVADGTYTGTGTEVVLFDKDVMLSGGWDTSFSVQDGIIIINGEDSRRGIRVNSGVNVTIDRIMIENGYGFNGGGILNEGTLTLSECSIENSVGYDSHSEGGGIHNSFGGTLSLNYCEIMGNTAYTGGGIYNNNGSVTLNNSSVSGNKLTSGSGGGGIKSSGTLILNNSTVSGNIGGSGGGIYGGATLYNSTITNNQGSNGGGVWGNMSLQNSIIAGNEAWWAPDCSGTMTTLGYNLIGDSTNCTFTPGTGDLSDVAAKIGPLVGSPGYHPLAFDSPAVDAGNPAGCTGSTGPLATDQRGAARVGVCDIGAYEYTSPTSAESVLVVNGSPQHAPPLSEFWYPFSTVVVDSSGSPVDGIIVTFTAPGAGASGTFEDSGTNITTASTDEFGIATSAAFTANSNEGAYSVNASVSGVTGVAEFLLGNLGWYVTTGGDDSNDCKSPITSCLTIEGALGKADFYAGDTILVASGIYTDTGDNVITIDQDVAIVGGWDADFDSQSSPSIIDGEGVRRGIEVKKYSTVIIERLAIKNGFTNVGGGGILNSGDLTLNACTINDNFGASVGGGIYNENGKLTLNNCSIYSNRTGSGGGGGIANGSIYTSLPNTLILNNSTISSNTADSRGGGIENTGTVFINNSTISENYSIASFGSGGIKNESGGSVTLQNSIVAGNIGEYTDCNGSISSSGYNIIGTTSGCTFTPSTGDQVGIAPNLTPLDDHGGYTLTHGLSAGSIATNAGNPSGCTNDNGDLLFTDQRGAPRVGQCDIGAYEAGLVATKEVTGNFQPGGEVTFTLTLSNEEGGVDLSNVSIMDSLPPSLSYVPGSYSDNNGTGGETSGVITWNGTVYGSSNTVITFSTNIDAGLSACSIVQNSAHISHDVDFEFEELANVVVTCQICSVSKEAGNPILEVGAPGNWDDVGVSHPSVILDSGTYKMWYSGYDGANPSQIGLATSTDGLTWVKEGTNPVLSPSRSWEETGVSRSSVILDGSVYKMWYTGTNNAGVIQIGYASSPDGINWVKFQGNPVLVVGSPGSWDDEDVSGPTVIKDGNTYHMWYGGYDGSTFRIGHASSSNGITWIKDPSNPVLDVGDVGDWDWLATYSPEATKIGDDYRLWYSGETLPIAWQTGYAESRNGGEWVRRGMIVPEGSPGNFDSQSADHPTVLMEGDKYRIWYSGWDGSVTTIGLAEGSICPMDAFIICLPLVMKNYSTSLSCPPDYSEDFSDPGSGWYIYEDSTIKFDYTGGEYQIWIKNPDDGSWVTPGVKASDFTVAISAHRMSGTEGPYGILFGINQDWSELYEVSINEDYYAIWKYDSGWSLLTWNTSAAIQTGTAWNRIEVVRDGTAISVFINDIFQTTVYDGSFTGFRRIGLSVYSPLSTDLDVRFDDFALYPATCGAEAGFASGIEWGEAEAQQGIMPPPLSDFDGNHITSWLIEPGTRVRSIN
jgi:uncharacterized repeat protein (TIGR01451 family)